MVREWGGQGEWRRRGVTLAWQQQIHQGLHHPIAPSLLSFCDAHTHVGDHSAGWVGGQTSRHPDMMSFRHRNAQTLAWQRQIHQQPSPHCFRPFNDLFEADTHGGARAARQADVLTPNESSRPGGMAPKRPDTRVAT